MVKLKNSQDKSRDEKNYKIYKNIKNKSTKLKVDRIIYVKRKLSELYLKIASKKKKTSLLDFENQRSLKKVYNKLWAELEKDLQAEGLTKSKAGTFLLTI